MLCSRCKEKPAMICISCLTDCSEQNDLKQQRDDLRDICEMVLRTKPLILPKGLIREEHKDEVIALTKMYTKVEAAIKKAQ